MQISNEFTNHVYQWHSGQSSDGTSCQSEECVKIGPQEKKKKSPSFWLTAAAWDLGYSGGTPSQSLPCVAKGTEDAGLSHSTGFYHFPVVNMWHKGKCINGADKIQV